MKRRKAKAHESSSRPLLFFLPSASSALAAFLVFVLLPRLSPSLLFAMDLPSSSVRQEDWIQVGNGVGVWPLPSFPPPLASSPFYSPTASSVLADRNALLLYFYLVIQSIGSSSFTSRAEIQDTAVDKPLQARSPRPASSRERVPETGSSEPQTISGRTRPSPRRIPPRWTLDPRWREGRERGGARILDLDEGQKPFFLFPLSSRAR